ncbi:MAG: YdcH family protein [Deltaproteobacteria bacterium]|nr:YdcH family protein [Deltaproteobacteria bacterium]
MEIQDEVVKKLLDEDEAFRKAYKAHKDYENKLERMEKKPRLSAAETVEKNRLKKMKLALKDEMEQRISKARAKG